MDDKKALIIIPANMKSKRLPCKPMLEAGGLPLVHHVYKAASLVKGASVFIATDSSTISFYCSNENKYEELLFVDTFKSHPTGTHRCAEAVSKVAKSVKWNIDVVVNWQVDEPFVEPEDVEKLIELTRATGEIATIVSRSSYPLEDHDIVKAMCFGGRCLWFQREIVAPNRPVCREHIGVYAFPREKLVELGELKPTPLSKATSLEQLAWIENGYDIRALETPSVPLSINTPEDFERFRERVEA